MHEHQNAHARERYDDSRDYHPGEDSRKGIAEANAEDERYGTGRPRSGHRKGDRDKRYEP